MTKLTRPKSLKQGGTVATISLFWAVAGGAIKGMKDDAPTNNKNNENSRKDIDLSGITQPGI